MEIDNAIKYAKWLKGIDNKKERQLREMGVSEDTINELKEMDNDCIKKNRAFTFHEQVTEEKILNSFSNFKSFKEITSLKDLMDEIENEILYNIINDSDDMTKSIIDLKYQGYNLKEISLILGVSEHIIYKKFGKIKKIFKKWLK